MTLRLMEAWGAHNSVEADQIVVPGGQWYRAQRFVVEADASSASYFAAAAALIGGAVKIEGLSASNSVQGVPRISRRAAADGRTRQLASRLRPKSSAPNADWLGVDVAR